MTDISLTAYDCWRDWIRRVRKSGKEWDSIRLGNRSDETGLKAFIQSKIEDDCFSWITLDVWFALVDSEQDAETERLEIERRTNDSMLVDSSHDNNAAIATSEGSSWQLYRKHLRQDMGFSDRSLTEIEQSCFRILKRLSSDTTQTGPVKGLVVGNVQSGKTANMAGLMAMAADNSWNMFIILSGTIENLRRQTEDRLNNDLNNGEGNLDWQPLNRDDLKKNARASSGQTRHLHLEEKSRRRYFAVCLKNKKRLENLIKWLQSDPNAQQRLRVLVIDDEADQASVNTGDVMQGDSDRKTINRLILNLVENRTHTNKPCESFYRAMNYVCYTATPYANFLNENYPDSLYPKDFLIALQPSKQYFGPNQIFGTGEEDTGNGMNIIRTIERLAPTEKSDGETDEYDEIQKIHKGESEEPPESFRDSLAWFLCSVAAIRRIGYKKPLSMLVHTSVSQTHHDNFEKLIRNMLTQTDRDELLARCKRVYERETAAFVKEDLRLAYEDYERAQDDIPDYPPFDDIKPGIELILDTGVTAIPLNEEQDEMKYHAGIHLCIDNCANNGINDENMIVRLVYPTANASNYPSTAPAFIVVGGSTLSRGLTIEGLVSTYFARTSRQADSLMQMGRWFGYRRNYELFPRLWMYDETKEKFEFMTQLDNELREELKLFHVMGKKPLEYGPRIKNSPLTGFLRITAKNKMQMATEVDFDFSGVQTETITFRNDEGELKRNMAVAEDFIRGLSDKRIAYDRRGYVWHDVDFSIVKSRLLNRMAFAPQGQVFNQLQTFLEWIDKVSVDGGLKKWNVAVAGGVAENDDAKAWHIADGLSVGKIRRNNKYANNNPDLLMIGVLRDPKDLAIDLDVEKLQTEFPDMYSRLKQKNYVVDNRHAIRKASGYDKNPLLVVYLIDKNSEPNRQSNPNKTPTRKKLDAKADVVALSISIPGAEPNGNRSKRLQIRPQINPYDAN